MLVVTDAVRLRSEGHLLRFAGRDALDILRADLEDRYGWTGMELAVATELSRRRLVVRGTVLVPSIVSGLRRSLSALLDPGWTLDVAGVAIQPGFEWRTIKCPVLSVWREYDVPESAATLATELVPADGPVQVLARVKTATLIRGTDGTVGWTYDALGSQAPAFGCTAGHAAAIASRKQFQERLRSRLGVPYRLGGTTSVFDCSGLVQRIYREAVSVTIPRHSTDQRRYASRNGSAFRHTGELVFLWARAEAPCHVGIVLASRRGHTVIHASHSRRMVVEDPLEDFITHATRVEYARLDPAAWGA